MLSLLRCSESILMRAKGDEPCHQSGLKFVDQPQVLADRESANSPGTLEPSEYDDQVLVQGAILRRCVANFAEHLTELREKGPNPIAAVIGASLDLSRKPGRELDLRIEDFIDEVFSRLEALPLVRLVPPLQALEVVPRRHHAEANSKNRSKR
jgi:hypothetical protein